MVGAFIEKGGEDEGYVDSGGMDGGDSRLPDRMCMLSMSQSRRPLIFFKYEKSVAFFDLGVFSLKNIDTPHARMSVYFIYININQYKYEIQAYACISTASEK